MAILALLGGVAFFFTFRDLDRREDTLKYVISACLEIWSDVYSCSDLKAGEVDEVHAVTSRREAEKPAPQEE